MDNDNAQKTQAEKMQEFAQEYAELCQKFGMTITAEPVFVPTNHGSYELTIRQRVVVSQQ